MTIDYYARFGAQLLQSFSEFDGAEIHDVLGWLQDAPHKQSTEHALLWSQVLARVFSENDLVEKYYSQLTTCAHDYFQHLLAMETVEFVDLSVSSELVTSMCALRSGKAQGIIESLVVSGWTPNPLLAKFEAITEAALRKKSAQLHFPAALENVGSGQFFKALIPLLSSDISKYGLQADINYDLLLAVHCIEGNEVDLLESQTRFLGNIAALAPSKLPQLLLFLNDQYHLIKPHFDILFPLPLSLSPTKEHAQEVLKSLLALVLDEQSDTGQHTLTLLREHHPELGALVDMHLSIFPDASWNNTYAEVLVPSYWNLLHPQSVEPPEQNAIPQSIFACD